MFNTHGYDYNDESRSPWLRSTRYKQDVFSTESAEKQDFGFVLLDGALIDRSSIASRYQSILSGVDAHIEQMIEMAVASDSIQSIEGIQRPNDTAKDLTFKTAKVIFAEHNLIPIAIRSSVEGGIMITYWNSRTKCSLKIEVYNDGERTGLVNRNKRILRCIGLISTTDITQLVEPFNG